MSNIWQIVEISTNTVVNVILWDGISEYAVEAGYELLQLGDDIGIGATKNEDGTWDNPASEVFVG